MNQTDQMITTLPHIFCGCALAPTCLFLCCFPESAWDLLQFCPPTAVFGKGRMGTYIIWNHLWIGLNSHVHCNPPSPGFSSLWLKFELAQTSCKKSNTKSESVPMVFFVWTYISSNLFFMNLSFVATQFSVFIETLVTILAVKPFLFFRSVFVHHVDLHISDFNFNTTDFANFSSLLFSVSVIVMFSHTPPLLELCLANFAGEWLSTEAYMIIENRPLLGSVSALITNVCFCPMETGDVALHPCFAVSIKPAGFFQQCLRCLVKWVVT